MTQRFSFWEDLTIRENLDFIARMYGMHDARKHVDEALEHLGLTSRANQLAGALSGGWKQRLALAACLLHDPQLLLLDEPTAGVDPKARRDFWEELHALAARGITVLVSTHYMDEAERCHRLGYILYGKLLAQGTASEVIASQALTTWSVAGADLPALAETAARAAGRRAGRRVRHRAARQRDGRGADCAPTLTPLMARARTRRGPRSSPGLEDVFIHLMRDARRCRTRRNGKR